MSADGKEEIAFRLDVLREYSEKRGREVSEKEFSSAVDTIYEINHLPDYDILRRVLYRRMREEFNGQITNLYNEDVATLTLQIQDKTVEADITSKEVTALSGMLDLYTEAVYVDDPFVIDELNTSSFQFLGDRLPIGEHGHRAHLRSRLLQNRDSSHVVDEILAEQRFKKIYELISSVCEGDLITGEGDKTRYRLRGSDQYLDARNLSTGMKTFAILKQLLLNGTIEQNGTIILDEPEIHLHPEWQLLFAELVVLIHQQFGVHVLLNTHSPYFLNAVEVYAKLHGVSDSTRYYYAFNRNQRVSGLREVTDNLETIYRGLARPLQKLENMRYQDGE